MSTLMPMLSVVCLITCSLWWVFTTLPYHLELLRFTLVSSQDVTLLLMPIGLKLETNQNSHNSDNTNTHTHTHPFNGPLSGTTQVSRYQKGKTNLDFTGARDSEWQWHRLGNMQVCTFLQTDNYTSTSLLSFLQAGCPSCRQTNSVKALKAQ